ncbi:uncharacterized protein LOC113559229 [Rhopalosiphum maidis]|uniref:uncharacterized protein LOC113559229 n=1 Tax=Rhopalosiphum maidis TaxID=43146 RepID=UPI000EFF65D1|nr:uncharacterized protein LOC113559229 [Rhopalosiphum maidis]
MFSYDYLILLSNILIVAVPVHSQSKPSLGISSCYYVGDVYVDCGSQNVSIAEIPKECTAIIVDGIDMTEKNKVKSPGEEKQFPADLDLILKSSKNVFIFYGHHTEEEWAQVLNTENDHKEKKLNEEMKALKTYLDQHPGIKGLIIKNLEFDANSTNVSNYSENLKVYLDAMRSNFPNMSIGLFWEENL